MRHMKGWAGGKVLSLAVESAANYGSAGPVDYGSKDNATPAWRPTLIVTYRSDAQPGISGVAQAEAPSLARQ